MHFVIEAPGWPSGIDFVNNKTRFKQGFAVVAPSSESQLILKGATDWRLRATSALLDFDAYYSSAWQTVFSLAFQSGAADQVLLTAYPVIARSGSLVIDQACSTEDHIVSFQKTYGGTTVKARVYKDGWLVCDDSIGVRTVYSTSAPSGGTVGDVEVYTDTSSYTSYLKVNTSGGWLGLELTETP